MSNLLKDGLRNLRRRLRNKPPATDRMWKPSWLPKDFDCRLESQVHPHIARERAELFLAYNTGSTEIEVLNWLHSTVCLTKPDSILETGAADGLGTIALASACRDNGFGRVCSVENDPAVCNRLESTLRRYRLSKFVEVQCSDSLGFLRQTDHRFQFAFFDSMCEIRAEEYRICRDRGLLKGIAAFHDTSPYRTQSLSNLPPEALHGEYRRQIHELARDPRTSGIFENRLSRGLFVIFPNSTD
ncbi:MAG TPA: class I SAM-dependent methyltransferase [Opitutaceae bacterium]|nr:class I SAM-dependent methyltransferase [Opitutaceae bacterium]